MYTNLNVKDCAFFLFSFLMQMKENSLQRERATPTLDHSRESKQEQARGVEKGARGTSFHLRAALHEESRPFCCLRLSKSVLLIG
jgi:hypothetical protein